MVGIGRKNAHEAVSTHAEGQLGGTLRLCASLSASFRGEWMAGENCGCVSADIREIFPGKDGLCYG